MAFYRPIAKARAAANQPRPPAVRIAGVVGSGRNLSALSLASSSESRVRGAMHPALDGAHRAIADRGRLLMGKSGRAALVRGQLRKRRAAFLELDMAVLFGLRF